MKKIISLFLMIFFFASTSAVYTFALGDSNNSNSSKTTTEEKNDFQSEINIILKDYENKKLEKSEAKEMIISLSEKGCDEDILQFALTYLDLCDFTSKIINEYLKGDWCNDDELYYTF